MSALHQTLRPVQNCQSHTTWPSMPVFAHHAPFVPVWTRPEAFATYFKEAHILSTHGWRTVLCNLACNAGIEGSKCCLHLLVACLITEIGPALQSGACWNPLLTVVYASMSFCRHFIIVMKQGTVYNHSSADCRHSVTSIRFKTVSSSQMQEPNVSGRNGSQVI